MSTEAAREQFVFSTMDIAEGYLRSADTVYRASWTALIGWCLDAKDRMRTESAMGEKELGELMERKRKLVRLESKELFAKLDSEEASDGDTGHH